MYDLLPPRGLRGVRLGLSVALLCTTALPALAAAQDSTMPVDDATPAELHADRAQDILVTARADKKSRALQRQAPNIMQSISQEEAFRLPDVNAGEVIARLPGVTIGSDKGIGHFVNIRGLDADLTSTTFGGTHLPPPDPVTPQNGGRAFSFDALPIGLFGTMSITKTNRPDMDAEALGGTIEITPKAIPANRDHVVLIRVGSGEQLSRHTGILDLSGSAGLRFGGSQGNRPFSIVVAGSWYRDALGMDDRRTSYVNKAGVPALAWSSMSQSNNKFIHRTRGISAELAYEPDAASRYYMRYLNSGYIEDNWRQQINFKTNGAATVSADGSLTSGLKQVDKSLRDTLLHVNLQLAEIGSRTRIGKLKLDYKASYTQGREYRPYDTISTFSAKPTGATINYRDAGGYFPAYRANGFDPFGTNGYTLSSVTDNTNLYRTREWSGAANALLPVPLTGGKDDTIKFGAAVRLRTNTHVYTPLTSTGVPAIGLAAAAPGPNVITDQNHYMNGPDIGIDYTRNVFARGTGAGFTTSATANAYSAALAQQDNRENVFAGYVQGESDLGGLHLIAGLRVEHTDATYRGNIATGSAFTPTSAQSRYTNLFPSLQARYSLGQHTQLRAAFSSAIARPGFNQIDPAATVDAVNNTVSTGNPRLKPITARNFDLSFEHYLPFGGIASVGLFDKELLANIRSQIHDS